LRNWHALSHSPTSNPENIPPFFEDADGQILFEDKTLADIVVIAGEKQIHYAADTDPTKQGVTHIEERRQNPWLEVFW
jgi:hypothetical protein